MSRSPDIGTYIVMARTLNAWAGIRPESLSWRGIFARPSHACDRRNGNSRPFGRRYYILRAIEREDLSPGEAMVAARVL